jgi:hypothetical protein
VKRISILAMLLAAVTIFSTSCGQSDYLQSVQLSAQGATAGGSYNLPGVDATLQLQVLAVYHSGKQVDVTNNATWTVTPEGCVFSGDPLSPCGPALPAYGPNTVPISTNGLMQGIADICTWMDLTTTTNGVTTGDTPPEWVYTGYYQVVANYRNFTSNPIGVGVGVATSNSPTGGCGPTNSTGS